VDGEGLFGVVRETDLVDAVGGSDEGVEDVEGVGGEAGLDGGGTAVGKNVSEVISDKRKAQKESASGREREKEGGGKKRTRLDQSRAA
jgi:hypothetical protein